MSTESRGASISIADFCAALYCAYAPADAFEPSGTAQITFTARSTENGHDLRYRVAFDGVTDLTARHEGSYSSALRGPLELSVIEVEGRPGQWRVWFNPWYLHEIEFRCTEIRLNGASVRGTGRHLQDELPTRTPAVPSFPEGAA